ncbi:MAG: YceI family protein [Pedosphaera sp.]|nr:YceI family protein [Pedosphaera sp.]
MTKFNSISLRYLTTALGCLLLFTAMARAEDFVKYRARPVGTKVHIDGSANVHDWTLDGVNIAGSFEFPAGVTLDSAQAAVAGVTDKLAAHAEVSIPVDSLSSGTPAMDQVMQEAMDAKDHPRIEYRLGEMTLKPGHAAGAPFQFDTKGELTINGVTKKIDMPVSIQTVDKTKLKIIGGPVTVAMPDYNVKPPVKLGLFITKPDVKISFEWVVGVSTKPVATK